MRKRWWVLLSVLLLVVVVPVAGAYWLYEETVARTQGEFFDSDGAKIHYTVEGDGEPVILVHGFIANADLNWRSPGFNKALSKEYKVIALDNRGHGLSDKPHDPGAYGEQMVKDIVNLMDHLAIDKAHVVGYSMGGFITLKLLTMYPDRLLSASPCGMGWAEINEENRATIDRIATSLEEGKGFGPLFERLNLKMEQPGMVGGMFNRLLSRINDTDALAAAMRGMEQLVVTEDMLRNNQVPTLTVVGSIDPLGDTAARHHEIMQNHELVLLEGADHISAMRHADYIPALLNFLRAHPAGSWAYAPVGKNAETPDTQAEAASLPDAA